MKRILKIVSSVLVGLVVLLLAAMILIPVFFKDRIKEVVVNQINDMLLAKVEIGDFSLGFFKKFPDLTFSLNDVYVIGKDKFEGDTLAGIKSLSVVFNIRSLFGSDGYEIKSVILNKGLVNAIALADGSVNWDIMKPDSGDEEISTVTEKTADDSSSMKLLLRSFLIKNSTVTYTDAGMNMSALLDDLNFSMKGDMTLTETDLLMAFDIRAVDVIYDGIRYLNRAPVKSEISLKANLDDMLFHLKENFLSVNDLILKFDGSVAMPDEDIHTDLNISAGQTSFKSLLSMVPAVYMSDFEGLKADGTFSLEGTIKGTYSDADSTLPDVGLRLAVRNGLISYPGLPEKISAIAMDLNIAVDGKDMDKTIVDMPHFHFELAGNPFNMAMMVKTPMSDPEIKASASGKIDFASLANAIPVEDMKLGGLLETRLEMAGKMSMIEYERYQDFHAAGAMSLGNMRVEMTDMPPVTINRASLNFNPATAELTECVMKIGENSDFSLTGSLSNYIPWVFSGGTIRGRLTLVSKLTDLDEIMSAFAEDTIPEQDTTALALIVIPRNIDFTFGANIDRLIYGSIKPNALRGTLIIRDGTLTVSETGMELMGGCMSMNALYDTRDTLKPVMKADMAIENLLVKAAYESFNSIKQLAPASKGIDGAVSVRLKFESLLGSDMMPLLNTIMGEGLLSSSELQLVDIPTFSKMKDVLKLKNDYTNTFKDLKASFRIKDGRVFLTPFDTKLGNVKLNISGDQGFDQSLNYFIKTEIPRAELGTAANELIEDISAKAAGLGVPFTPSDIIKVNLKVGGRALKPEVTPDFGGTGSSISSGLSEMKEQLKTEVKEAVTAKVDEAKEKARAEAEAQADRIISEAGEKARIIKEEAAAAAEKIRQEADIQAQKIIMEAEGKNAIVRAAAEKSAQALKNEAAKKASQLEKEADEKARKLVDEAVLKKEELLKKF